MRVLSLFDGISGARQALKELNIDCDYYASEIDKYAIQIAQANHPDIIQLGDIKNVGGSVVDIDLMVGGFPCQSFSIAGNRKGLEDDRGQLFFDLLRIFEQVKPKYFLFENVASMSKANQAFISGKLGVEPIMINSALLTAQQRKRSYWVGKLIDGKYEQVKINQPKDKGVLLEDILQDLPDCPLGIKVRDKSNCLRVGGRNSPFGSKQIWDSPFQRISKKGNIKPGIEKASCLTGGGNSGGNPSDMDLIHSPFVTRRYSILECERLQGFPDDYTNHVSNTQRYKSLGNSFTVPVIKHILTNSIK